MLRSLGPDDIVEPRELDAEHLAIEKEQGTQSLVLGRGRHLVVNGKGGQECRDLGGAQLSRVALAVEEDVPLDPMDVGLLGATTVVSGADGLADLIEKARLWARAMLAPPPFVRAART